MRKEYIKPVAKIVKFDAEDIVTMSVIANIDTAEYGFTESAVYTNQGQEWLDKWSKKQ